MAKTTWASQDQVTATDLNTLGTEVNDHGTRLDTLESGTYEPIVNAIWLPGKIFDVATGTPAWGTSTSRLYSWQFDAAANESVTVGLRQIPSHWATMDVDFYGWNFTADSGDVMLSFESNIVEVGATIDATPAGGQVTVTADSQWFLRVHEVATGIPVTPSKFMTIRVGRTGAFGGDTKVGDWSLHGVMLRKAS